MSKQETTPNPVGIMTTPLPATGLAVSGSDSSHCQRIREATAGAAISIAVAAEPRWRRQLDGHDVDGVRAALMAGADVSSPIDGKRPIQYLLEQYERSDRLRDCLCLLLERGATLDDPVLIPRTSMVSAFTSLVDVSLLHVAAEFGNLKAARALVESGANVNATAGVDEFGLNGHTPIFHTVNSIQNRSAPILRLLVDAGADTRMRIDGIHWGTGYPWETTFYDVTPVSYAQMGLMPQVHRKESDVYSNITVLLQRASHQIPLLRNVPNRYLYPKNE
jgi:Ankyrin repeats (many copies)